ncbi:glycosyltransferase family 4 protein [Olivibacter sp. SA151]|uniref:glycosyltransferase family 4 protein n=1 Tax=Olivibacter jilunii TaxID=985016 RepID=UPI003F166A61
MKRRTIWIVNQFASMPQNSFGAGERFFHLLEYFSKKFNCRVFSGSFSHLLTNPPQITGTFTDERINDGSVFTWIKLKHYKDRSYIGRVWSWFEFTVKLFRYPCKYERPDIILVSSMSLIPLLYGIWLKWRFNSKFILEIRDIWPLTPIEIGGFSRKHPLMLILGVIERLGYKHADCVTSVLPEFESYLREHRFKYKRFVWIPNAIKAVHEVEIEKDKKSVALSENVKVEFSVLYTGTLGNANAMEYFIQAAKYLVAYPIQFLIIGDGPLKCDLLNMAKGINNVQFLPKVLKADLKQWLVSADLCFIGWHNKPLYRYGVAANKYNDYMLAKKPILSSSNISSDPVRISKCGINVAAEKPKEIAKGVLKLYNMSAYEREELGRKGYDYLMKHKTYTVIGKKYLELFDQLLLV